MKKIIIILLLTLLITGCNKEKIEPNDVITEEEKMEDPLTMSLSEFTLDKSFISAQVKENKSDEENYIENIIFVGDSVPLYYVITENITGKQLWHKEGMSIKDVFTQQLYVNHMESGKTMVELFQDKKPKLVIVSLGMNSVATMSKDYFIDEYTKLIIKLKEVSPNTTIIINSIPPVAASYDEQGYELNNQSINEYNYYILKMCNDLDVKFLNSAKVLKDEKGQCKTGYFIEANGSERAHQTKLGNDKIFEYIKNHAV